jgi:predicted ATP-grasp superfamily ATP-dependent carboligase
VPRDFGTRFTATAAARAARAIECDAVMYLSSFENHPKAVSSLAAGRRLWGNPPAVLRRVRDPVLVSHALRKHRLPGPAVRFGPARRGTWLAKPLASGGGRRVRLWHRGDLVPRRCYLQEFVQGTPGSIVFVAAGGRAVPIGMSRQLVGEPAFGATGFKYCGSILGAAGDVQFARDTSLLRAARALVDAIVREFGLVGVNGIDFVAHDGVPVAIEVNPRWTASVELVERAYGLPVLAAHAAACVSGALPVRDDFDLLKARRGVRAVGKAIVFARHDVTVGDTREWIDLGIRDVPHPGEHIQAGRAICTVLADGRDALGCHAALVERAERVYADLATSSLRVRRA